MYSYSRESAYRLKIVEREVIDGENVPVGRQLLSRNEIEAGIATKTAELAVLQDFKTACDDLEIISIPENPQE